MGVLTMRSISSDAARKAAPRDIEARQWKQGHWRSIEEVLSREERLRVEHPGGDCSLWAWPHDLAPLALGHALLDRLHRGAEDEPAVLRAGRVELLPGQGETLARVSLGEALPSPAAPPACGTVTAAHLAACMETVMSLPGMWDGTGCFHRAAMTHLPSGRVALVSEDIGRHNCLDRIAGQCCFQGLLPAAHALFVSARVTASLYAKARRMGFACIVSRAAITSASFDRAMEQGVTLVGFCRSEEERFTVFTDPAGRVLA